MASFNYLEELPFYHQECDWEELLCDGHISYKYPRDGIIDFHSIKMCSSNGKSLTRFFKYSMGFSEIAYKGLETGNHYTCSHVLSNGRLIIEIVTPLHGTDPKRIENPSSFKPKAISTFQIANVSLVTSIESEIDSFECVFKGRFNIDRELVRTSVLEKVQQLHSDNYDHEDYLVSKMKVDAIKLTRERLELIKIQDYILKHGDNVFDVSMKVESVENTYFGSVNGGGAVPISDPFLQSDEFGECIVAITGVPNTDIQHTLIQNINYEKGPFLPGYHVPLNEITDPYIDFEKGYIRPEFLNLDHCVFNFTWNQMMDYATFYAKAFGLHKYWSVDEQDVYTGNTSLKSIVMASSNGNVKIPINEPGEGKKRGQIEEFYDFNEGPGIQHVAIRTKNIIATVKSLYSRGIEFNSMRLSYYDDLKKRLERDGVSILEDLDELKKLNILVDYDPNSRNTKTNVCNYILQIFTKPFSDRPTLFFEVIQRRHHNGFGKGTFKGLFESIEAQQMERGTLTDRL